jgi:DNA-binding transcriptional LysR family regulator
MGPVSYELLKTFVEAASAPTFGAAARKRRVSASSISQQIKALEAQLGVPLFARVGRRVRVTEAGTALLASLRDEFSRIDSAVEEASSAHRAVRGRVALGGPRAFGRFWLRPRLAALLRQHEHLRLLVEFGVPSVLERRLVEGSLDLALLSRPTELPNVASQAVASEIFCLVGAPSYLERYGTPSTREQFEEHRFLLFDADLPMHAAWWRAKFGAGASPGGVRVAEVACLDQMLALCEEGAGLAVLPDYLLAEPLTEGRLRLLQPDAARYPKQRPARNTLFLAWREKALASARFVAVRDALLSSPLGVKV